MKITNILYAALLATLITNTGCEQHDLDRHETFNKTVSALRVDVDSANVTIKPSKSEDSTVDVDTTYRGSKPKLIIKTVDETLKVSMSCPFSCDGDIVIKVPEAVAGTLSVGSGNLDIHDISGDLDINVNSGRIELDQVSGQLDLQADSGKISGEVKSTVCYADVDSGSISLKFLNTPKLIDAAADSGNIKLRVPEGAYRISTHIDSGSKDIDNVTRDSDSKNKISVDVDSGNVDIIGY